LTPVLAGKIVLIAIGLTASWLDATIRKLPNWLCLLTLAAGLVVTSLVSGPAALPGHLAHAFIALVVGMILFRLGVVGGGDAKFYAGVAVWFALSDALHLVMAVTLSGLAIFLVWFAWRRLKRKPIRTKPGDVHGELPYGIAISAGALITYLQQVA
jgi:prepilin peptidase CpaA